MRPLLRIPPSRFSDFSSTAVPLGVRHLLKLLNLKATALPSGLLDSNEWQRLKMHPSDNGAAAPGNRLTQRTISDVFLDAALEGSNEEFVPLTPSMIHIWRMHESAKEAALQQNKKRERFVYSFYDAFHQMRGPHRLASPPNTLQWLNQSALDVSSGFQIHANMVPAPKYYLTRYMVHVWKNVRRDMDVLRPDGYLRFLTWFALECIPTWNLPPLLLPSDLLPVLNHPVRPALPMTTAMRVLGELKGVAGISDIHTAPDALLVAMSFDLLPDLLQAGDPRLIPEVVSGFWSKKLSPDPESLTVYEYFAAQACRHGFVAAGTISDEAAASVRQWCATTFRAIVPQADPFFSAPPPTPQNECDSTDLNSPEKAVVIYRDHQTIAGLSKAGFLTKEAFSRAGLKVIDLDFSFGRGRMLEEYIHNQQVQCCPRSTLHVLNLNPEYIPEVLMCHLSGLNSSSYLIGQFYWELSDTAPIHDCGLSVVNEIWVASEYLRDVYQRRVSVPVYVMGQAIEPRTPDVRFTRAYFNLPENAYMFLFSFDASSVVERKNPLASAQAFRKAFPLGTENAILVLKTRNTAGGSHDRDHWRRVMDIAGADKRIHIIDHTMTSDELTGLLAICDCYISLHRSEGFGYGPAEAMGLGKPVITTGYSGVTDFCTSETALPIGYVLERVPQGAYPYMDDSRQYYWASPDVDDAASQMRRLYEAPRDGERLGQCGRQLIRDHYSVEALQRRYLARLTELGWL
jgi:glycosyltransferase involved in cell wall biosynthesis